jgi:hypothetical protein
MTVEFALVYIPGRMRELGYDDEDYFIKPRHFVLQANETRDEAVFDGFLMLVEEPADVSVNSDSGVFDLNATANELDYEHQGQVELNNNADDIRRVRFIQVIITKCEK